jgi:golgi to ER traffic protein 4
MASVEGGRGVAKLLTKISQSLEEKKFYEGALFCENVWNFNKTYSHIVFLAHQIYRTIYFRYSKQEKFKELAELLFDGAVKLIAEREFQSGADLSLLLIEILQKCKYKDGEFENWMSKVAKIIESIDQNVVERDTLIVRAIKWSCEGNQDNPNQGHPLMHRHIAQIMSKEKNYEQARSHYLLSKDGQGCANVLIQISLTAYKSEIDLVIVQSVLNLLVLKEISTAKDTFDSYTNQHPSIRTSNPPYKTPLLNFLYFLLHLIDDPKLQSFTSLCELYKPALARDPEYDRQLKQIGVSYFGAKPPRQQTGGGLFGGLFNQLFQELENDDIDDDDDLEPQPSTSKSFRTGGNADLD